jgi:DNA polymerase (family 10)
VFRGARQIGGANENEVFEAVGLPWIPPELRENRGEIEAARAGRLPHLVELTDIRGDLQMHTDATDGKNTLAEMVTACEARGYEYVAITDHTRAVRVAGGLTAAGFHKQSRVIDALRKRVSKPFVLKGVEVDILENGSLDLDDASLAESMEVIKAARDHCVLLEINAQPDRLDLNDLHIHMARDAGVKLVISTDAHRIQELDCIRFGVDQARRGWCEAKDVANTYHVVELQKLIKK